MIFLSECYNEISTIPQVSDTNDELERYLQWTDSLVNNEGLFHSASGNTVTETRNCLSSQKVDRSMFIQKNVSTLNKIFGKVEKSNNLNSSIGWSAQKGEKRPCESLSNVDDNDADNVSDDEEWQKTTIVLIEANSLILFSCTFFYHCFTILMWTI